MLRWYLGPWRKYAVFTGRATRREFWTFTLGNFAVFLALLACLGAVTGASTPAGGADTGPASPAAGHSTGATVLLVLIVLGWLAAMPPGLAVGCRRLHDIGRGGAWQLIALIPVVGAPLLFILNVLPGTVGPNRYGPDPQMNGAEDDWYTDISIYPPPGGYPPPGWSRPPAG